LQNIPKLRQKYNVLRILPCLFALALAGCIVQSVPDGGAEVDSSFLLFEQRSAEEAPPARLAAYL
jgi:hypothetical protein